MKSNKLKQTLKISGTLFVAIFLGAFIWANWNALTPAEKLKPKAFALYDLSNVKNNDIFTQLDADLKKTNGVLAECVKPADKIVSVVYYPDVVNREDIMTKLTQWSNTEVRLKKIVANGPTCPVAGMMGVFSTIKRSLCIRS